MSPLRKLSLRTRITVIGQAMCAITRLPLGPAAADVLAGHVLRRLRARKSRHRRADDASAIIRSYGALLGIALATPPVSWQTPGYAPARSRH